MTEEQCVNELRVLSAEMITNANSGHPGIALGSAPILYSLYANVLAVDPACPKHYNRDRIVLSAGHASSILYAILHAFGYNITIDDLRSFRKIGSNTPGHPEVNVTDGIDASTGPLGQGIANAVGMCIAEKNLEATFNKKDVKLFNNKVYCLTGDGCLMEGISYEALCLAGTLNLNNLVLIYDYNKITIEGKLDISSNENIELRFKSIGFDVKRVKDGNSVVQITKALLSAKKAKKPTVVIVPTTIGYGSELAGNEKVHGSPLTIEMIESLKANLKVEKPKFDLSDGVKEYLQDKANNAKLRLFERNKETLYKEIYPKEYKRFKSYLDSNNYDKYIEKIKKLNILIESSTTRDVNHIVMQEIAKIVPNFIGGSADVATSTKAYIESKNSFSSKCYESRYMHYGVREHAMAGISNGIALYGGFIPYQSCFLTFMDYLKPALRMSALQNLKVFSVFSHDSITAGQDGPTHQPIEQIGTLRSIPNTIVSRPYNTAEVIATYIWLLMFNKPTNMLVAKDKTQFVQSDVESALKGGYVLQDFKNANLTLVSTGYDVDRCLKIADILKKTGIYARVVSMPCVSIFESQTKTYQKSVLKDLPKVFVEASNDAYWYKMAKDTDLVLLLQNFGKSGAPKEVESAMKFDANSLSKQIISWYKKKSKNDE